MERDDIYIGEAAAVPQQPGARRYYSPSQISVAAFLFGPMAAGWFLSRNYLFVAERQKASNSLLISMLWSIVLGGGIPLLPEHLPKIAIPILNMTAYRIYANHLKLSSPALADPDKNRKASMLGYIVMSLVFLIAFFALFTIGFMIAVHLLHAPMHHMPVGAGNAG